MTDQASPPASSEPSTSPAAPPPEPGRAPGGAPPSGHAAPAWRPSYPFLVLVSLATLASDLGSKMWAKARLDTATEWSERHIDVIKGYWAFRFARNRGGAWGLLGDQPESIRRPFFLAISILAIFFIVSLYRKLTQPQLALRWGLPLVLGGALGNLVNRIQYNYVVDFIDLSYQGHHWPTFNVADIAIVAGVVLMAIDMFTPRRETTKIVASAKASAEADARSPIEAPPQNDAPAAPKET